MKVTREPFDDRSESDANGMYDYIYVGAKFIGQLVAKEIASVIK